VKRPVIALAVLGIFALIYGWNAVLLAPRASQRAEASEQLVLAQAQEQTLRGELAQLRMAAADGNTQENEIGRLARLVPAGGDLPGFIRTLEDVAAQSLVDWSSLTPAAPTAGTGGAPTTIGLTISVAGTFFQILDYLKRLEGLDRLVVVDAVALSAATASGGTPSLTVNLQARIFTADPGPAATPVAVPIPTGAG
jgi:Tfp pilus assembly protein PilO